MSADFRLLVEQYIDGSITEADAKALERQLKSDARLRDWYLDALNLDAALASSVEAAEMARGMAGHPLAESRGSHPSRPRFADAKTALFSAAAALLAAFFLLRSLSVEEGVPVEITRVSDGASTGWKQGERFRVAHLEWKRGSLEMILPSGVRVSVDGPANLDLLSAMEIRLKTGKVTADVGPYGKGFVIETPEARIVDLGTAFGVDATNASKTDVMVFSGQVEIYERGGRRPVAQLSQGEGLRLERSRRTSRISRMKTAGGAERWLAQAGRQEQPLIPSVADDMSADEEEAQKWPSLRSFYRIVPGGLSNGALAFTDAADLWSDVPPELVGADQVLPFAIDSHNWWMKLTLDLSRPCELFVFCDRRNPAPKWVSDSFTDTSKTITLEFKPDHARGRVVEQLSYSVWSRKVAKPGPVTLGAPFENPPEDRKNFKPNRMFGIAARDLP